MARGTSAKGSKQERGEEKRRRKEMNRQIQAHLKWVLPSLGALFLVIVGLIIFFSTRPQPAPVGKKDL
ncbi:hypothetical protein WJX72_008867 [[Myrmecia] bisecta]|uniref:Single-pass membrane and coiled-coil domain-containing protein 4 homolog n=1 Tax=[Myrmecia] bisecta TaxID=41462 RepID=A0AAW1Q7U0_9CHLO